jgi:hypothetical protein
MPQDLRIMSSNVPSLRIFTPVGTTLMVEVLWRARLLGVRSLFSGSTTTHYSVRFILYAAVLHIALNSQEM